MGYFGLFSIMDMMSNFRCKLRGLLEAEVGALDIDIGLLLYTFIMAEVGNFLK